MSVRRQEWCELVGGSVPVLGRGEEMWMGDPETASQPASGAIAGAGGVRAAPSSAPPSRSWAGPWEGHACLGVGSVGTRGGSVVAAGADGRLRMSRLTAHAVGGLEEGKLVTRHPESGLGAIWGRAPGKGPTLPTLTPPPTSELAGRTGASSSF